MLTGLDESFLHQSSLTFDQAATSDHRFFDRMWLGGHSLVGLHFLMGLSAYKNTNAFDGYFTLIKDGKQHNLRVSRPFLDDPGRAGAGPIDVAVLKPLQELRIMVAPGAEHGFSADLVFSGTVPATLEAPHFTRVDGRVTQDYSRFDQIGRINGWIEIGGERIDVENWFSARDHSWGVRPGMGGYEPPTRLPLEGENPRDVGAGSDGFLVVVLWFDTPSLAGYLMQMEDGNGKIRYSDGKLLSRAAAGLKTRITKRITHDLRFIEGTRACADGTLTVEAEDGEIITIEVESLLHAICYKGTGYDGGYNDEKGLGLHRGVVLEADVYDVSHPDDVILPDGSIIRPWHREAGAKVRIGGETGMAHFPCLSSGPIRRYGLGI